MVESVANVFWMVVMVFWVYEGVARVFWMFLVCKGAVRMFLMFF